MKNNEDCPGCGAPPHLACLCEAAAPVKTDQELFNRAVKAYLRGNAERPMPFGGLSTVDIMFGGDAYITLADANGTLARYSYNGKTDRLRKLALRREDE